MHTVKQNVVAFFAFWETAGSFRTNICSSGTLKKREAILFLFGE